MSAPARLQNRLRSTFSSSSQLNLGAVKSTTTTSIDQLDVLDQVLSELEESSSGVLAQAVPGATLQATDTLNPTVPTASLKEVEASATPDIGPVEAGAGLQQVEFEPSVELPVEVESYLKKVEDHQEQIPAEIVIADGTTEISGVHQPAQKPVVVLPITQAEEEEAIKQPLHWSVRWLAEWSRKIIKMFAGKVIYRQEPLKA